MCQCQHTFGPNRHVRYRCKERATVKIVATEANRFCDEVKAKERNYCSKHAGGWAKDAWSAVPYVATETA